MTEPPKDLKRFPENWEEMVEKLAEREKEQKERFDARRKVHKVHLEKGAETDPLKITKEILAAQAARAEPKQTVEDDTVLTKAKSPEIHRIEKEITEAASATSQKIDKLIQTMPSLKNKII